MKRVNKLAAAVALALSAGVASQAHAQIQLWSGGSTGDAMLFPAFNGYVDNYFTIHNTSGFWQQGHIRFRGASWTAELLDFDVILSPGDVFVFRLADLDGDGQWEIDMSLDPNNFAYTSVQPTGCNGTCIDASNLLVPAVGGVITQDLIDHQRNVGYVEFIGEAQLDGMTPARMTALLTAGSNLAPLRMSEANRTKVGNGLGTNAWVWSDAANAFAADRGLSDFPNIATGTGFISLPGQSHGLAYTSEIFRNFRTPFNQHRVENYLRNFAPGVNLAAPPANAGWGVPAGYDGTGNSAIILHDENATSTRHGPSPFGDYIYIFNEHLAGGRQYEHTVSFNNTWGPTLADGDDYSPLSVIGDASLTGLYFEPVAFSVDAWDQQHLPPQIRGNVDSIAEVETAIRAATPTQTFESFYFDTAGLQPTGAGLRSYFFAHFPTKFYYAENLLAGVAAATTHQAYVTQAVTSLLGLGKPVNLQVWDIFETSGGVVGGANTSPRVPVVVSTALGQELSFFDIGFFKTPFNVGNVASYNSGRVVLSSGANTPTTAAGWPLSWPMLAYTFEISEDGYLAHWRNMARY